MKNKSAIAILTLNTLLCIAIALCTGFFMGGWGVLLKAICYAVAAAGFLACVLSFAFKKQALFKGAFVLVCCAAAVVAVVSAISQVCGLSRYPTDAEKTEALVAAIRGLGGWGVAVYFILQVLQVVILPLPAAVCYIPGSLIWGPLTSTLIASAGVIVGSVSAYFIGKCLGKRAVIWIAGREITEKYSAYFAKHGKVLFLLMQILPFFPDDILCMVVGLTGMNFWFFLVSVAVVRPLIIAAYCYLGSGTVIPFSGWGIAVWIAIFAVCILFAVLSFKYQDRVARWLVNKFTRSKAKQSEMTESDCGGCQLDEAENGDKEEAENPRENGDNGG